MLLQRSVIGAAAAALVLAAACGQAPVYDVVVRDGTIYDGSGSAPVVGDVAIDGDSVVAVGEIGRATGRTEIDAAGLAVSPGFINMLSWATESLIEDGRGLSDVKQGVTLEIFGEGMSMGPLNEEMKAELEARQADITYEVEWTTLGEYLEHLVDRGISPNVASFVGATTVRVHEVGYEDRPPTEEELARMQDLVREGMREGALGVGSSLIYAPAFYADTDELIALASAAGEFGGIYISHMRSEANRLLESVDELITIATEAGVPAEIYHLKAAGETNYGKLTRVFDRVDAARARGVRITADVYPYTAGATGLDAAMPPWVQEGGLDAWVERLRDPEVRGRVAREMRAPTDEWENLLLLAGSAENVVLVGFKEDSLKHLTGMSLAEVAESRGQSPEETAMDLVVKDHTRVGTVYFMMSEENVRRKLRQPWVSVGSDAGAPAPEGVFLESNPHPRAYGAFARILGRYVREEGVVPLEEAIRRMTSLPAENLSLARRGRLEPGFMADVVVFDPETVVDHATFEDPHQLATGVLHVFVNGRQVLRDGEHTGATPGRVVRGPGWEGWDDPEGGGP
ncbi:MAG TPA: D-aminoacylase [Longimicrobiales bacterium]|nr:D-aminoacylase [Longimicrobiales bacterium]